MRTATIIHMCPYPPVSCLVSSCAGYYSIHLQLMVMVLSFAPSSPHLAIDELYIHLHLLQFNLGSITKNIHQVQVLLLHEHKVKK